MTDSHTKKKLWPNGYSATVPLNYRSSEYLRLNKYYLSSEPNKIHSCVKSPRKTTEDNDWLVFMLSFGLEQTLTDPNQMTELGNGNRLLRYAKLDNDLEKFSFPKSVCVTKDNMIIVADTGNNRVLGFNTGGVQTFTFSQFEYKNETCFLTSPLSICGLINGNIAICNYGNSTINVITQHGTSRLMFPCSSKPICIDSDQSGTMFILTELGEIEEFSKSGKIIKVTKINNSSNKIYTIMTVASVEDEIFLGKCNVAEIFVITKCGEKLRYVTLTIPSSGLNVFLSSLDLEPNHFLFATDSVNRSVYLFNSKTGEYKSTLVNGKNGVGCVQSVCLTKDKSLVTTEYSLNNLHCVKIFTCSYDFSCS